MSEELYSLIPGLREAVEKENFARHVAFLDLPEKVCGIALRPLRLIDLARLDAAGNAFMHGGIPTPEDVAAAFWLLSVEYSASRWTRRRFLRRVRRIPYAAAVKALDEYFNEAFADNPGGGSASLGPRYYSLSASLVDTFATEYGWSEQTTLHVPLQRLFQYLKIIFRRRIPKMILSNPSDAVRGRWLDEQNAKLKGN